MKALDAKKFNGKRFACPIEHQFSRQFRGHRRVHEAVTGEAAGTEKTLDPCFAQDGMLVGRHFVEARPVVYYWCISERGAALASFDLELWPEAFIDGQSERLRR